MSSRIGAERRLIRRDVLSLDPGVAFVVAGLGSHDQIRATIRSRDRSGLDFTGLPITDWTARSAGGSAHA